MESDKKFSDPRHQARRLALSVLFSWNFLSQDLKEVETTTLEELDIQTYDSDLYALLLDGVTKNTDYLDGEIKKTKLTLAFENIAKIDLIILRMAVLEIKIAKTASLETAIDEAVELAKEFGGEESYSFVNGVLGALV